MPYHMLAQDENKECPYVSSHTPPKLLLVGTLFVPAKLCNFLILQLDGVWVYAPLRQIIVASISTLNQGNHHHGPLLWCRQFSYPVSAPGLHSLR